MAKPLYWVVHGTISGLRYSEQGAVGSGGEKRRLGSTVGDAVSVTATSSMQARVRGLAELRARYPGRTVRITSVHPYGDGEDTNDSEGEQE